MVVVVVIVAENRQGQTIRCQGPTFRPTTINLIAFLTPSNPQTEPVFSTFKDLASWIRFSSSYWGSWVPDWCFSGSSSFFLWGFYIVKLWINGRISCTCSHHCVTCSKRRICRTSGWRTDWKSGRLCGIIATRTHCVSPHRCARKSAPRLKSNRPCCHPPVSWLPLIWISPVRRFRLPSLCFRPAKTSSITMSSLVIVYHLSTG